MSMNSTLNLTMLSPERFQAIYNSLNEAEQKTLTKILEELAETGESETYEKSGWRTMRKFQSILIPSSKTLGI